VSEDAEREQGENEETPDAEPEQPEAAAEEAPAEEQPAAEEQAEQPAGAEEPETPPAEEQAEQPAADAEPEQPVAEQPAAEAEKPAEAAPAEEQPAAERSAPKPTQTAKKDVVPGADLEPIAIGEERELTAEERAAREAEEEERRAREAAATADEDDDAIAPRTVTVPADTRIQATGKRKSAVARVIVRAGDGSFQINDRGIEEYFKSSQHQALARQPLVTAGYEGTVDVRVRVHGGGISGQAGAVRHGVARALTALEPELRGDLKRRGMLTRDDRRKERKKAGLKKARKRPQFSKR
jgi:small subunit ribosomal protein S9